MSNESAKYAPRPRSQSDLSHRAVRTARVLTRLPDGEHDIKLGKRQGSFVLQVETDGKVRKWSF